LSGYDPVELARIMAAFLKMKKLDIQAPIRARGKRGKER
jgi:hypothetical protein